MIIQPPCLQDVWDFQATERAFDSRVQLPGDSDERVVISEQVRGLTRWLSRERRLLHMANNLSLILGSDIRVGREN